MQVFRCERCLHVTPSSTLEPSVVRGALTNQNHPHRKTETSTQFFIQRRPDGFQIVDPQLSPNQSRPQLTVTSRADGEIHITTADRVSYETLIQAADFVFSDVLEELALSDYAGYPVLHYRRRSHPVISFEYLRRLYGVLPATEHSVERFEVTADGARYVITGNSNIYPVVSQSGEANLNAIVDDINTRVQDRTTDVDTSYTVPHVRSSWVRPVTALHPDAEAFVQTMHESDENVSLSADPIDSLSGNEQAVLVTSTVLCLLDALDDLGPHARQEVLESDAYVCRTLKRLLYENGISVESFVDRNSLLSLPLIEQLHDLQRTVQQLKPDVAYGKNHTLSQGQTWRVTDPETGEPVIVQLVGRDFLSGLEQMTDKVWIGRVEDKLESELTKGDVIPILSSQLLTIEEPSPSSS